NDQRRTVSAKERREAEPPSPQDEIQDEREEDEGYRSVVRDGRERIRAPADEQGKSVRSKQRHRTRRRDQRCVLRGLPRRASLPVTRVSHSASPAVTEPRGSTCGSHPGHPGRSRSCATSWCST